MRAGILTETITVIHPVIIKDSYGSEKSSWKEVITTRSNVKYNTGNRITENSEIINTYTVSFTIRNYHNVDESMRILYKGKEYRILTISVERTKQSATIIGELINE